MEKETIGLIIAGMMLMFAAMALTWKIAYSVFSERLRAAKEREKTYKEQAERMPELEKKLEKFERREQFELDAKTGMRKFEGNTYCPICFSNGIEMPVILDDYEYYCRRCKTYFKA